jgi:RNA polymerase sigma factor (sigma-70 family)
MQTTMRGPSNGALIHQLERLFHHGTTIGLTEGELLERFVGGHDEAAFEALIARHGPMVLGVCRQLLRDPNDVDDAFQATFLVLVRKAGTLRRRDLLGNWLYGVAHRVAMRSRVLAARRLARAPHGQDVVERLDAGRGHRDGDPSSGFDPEPGPWLHEEVRRLPEKYRTLVLLCYFEGLTHEEAARRLGCPIGTVKGRLARARDLLRKRLVRRGVTVSAAALAAHLVRAEVGAAVSESLKAATLKAARAVAGTAGASIVTATSVSLPVAALSDGVLRAMILTQAKAIAVPLLIAGIVTTGAVIGSAQQAGTTYPSLAQSRTRVQGNEPVKPKASAESVTETVSTATAPGPQEAGTKAPQLLAEELRADQEMFDYLTALNRDVRLDDTQMLIRLSQRMLAVSLDLNKGHASRLEAYKAHRERLTKLFDWTRHESGTQVAGTNNRVTNLVSARLKDADDLIEQEKKNEPAGASGDAETKGVQTTSTTTVSTSGSATTKAARGAGKAQGGAGGRGSGGFGGGMGGMGGGMGGMSGGMGGMGGGMGGMSGGMGGMGGGMGFVGSEYEFQNRVEIAQLAAALAANGTNTKDQAVLKKLEQPLAISFSRPTPLKELLNQIRSSLAESSGATVPIYVDPKGLEQAGVTLSTPVTMELEGIPLKTAMRLMLKQLGLAYCVRDGVLIISSLQGIREELAEAAGELRGRDPEQMGSIMQSIGAGMMGGGMR